MGLPAFFTRGRVDFTPEEVAAQRELLTERRRVYGYVFKGLMSNLSHLRKKGVQRHEWFAKFHQGSGKLGCPCAQCSPELFLKPLPDITDPDALFWNTEGMLEQRQSPLFGKLPTEIRMMIWEEMFAGFIVTLVRYRWTGGWLFQPNEVERWWQIEQHQDDSRPGWREFCGRNDEVMNYWGFGMGAHLDSEWRAFRGEHAALHRTCCLMRGCRRPLRESLLTGLQILGDETDVVRA